MCEEVIGTDELCGCVYCRQEPDHQREQQEEADRQADGDVTTARYQIERAIAQLNEPLIHNYAGEARQTIESVIAQLEAYLNSEA